MNHNKDAGWNDDTSSEKYTSSKDFLNFSKSLLSMPHRKVSAAQPDHLSPSNSEVITNTEFHQPRKVLLDQPLELPYQTVFKQP